jgi:pimeloyl-ACP methyl ester carboxylesterase
MTMSITHITAATQYVDAHGIRYAYRSFGVDTGVPLVCLQHFRGGLDNWDPLVTDGLAKGRTVILFNNAGVSSSSGEPADTIDGMAEHVLHFVDALGLTQIDLLGFSMGGFVAQEVVLKRPELVRRLVLAGTGPRGGEAMVGYPDVTTAHATQDPPVEENFLHLFFYPSETSQEAGHQFWIRRHYRLDQDPPSSLAVMHAQANAINTWGGVPRYHRYADLGRITQPTLVVQGKTDVMVPTVNSYILQQHLPHAELIIYPDSGHGSIFQFAERFVSDATRFLGES